MRSRDAVTYTHTRTKNQVETTSTQSKKGMRIQRPLHPIENFWMIKRGIQRYPLAPCNIPHACFKAIAEAQDITYKPNWPKTELWRSCSTLNRLRCIPRAWLACPKYKHHIIMARGKCEDAPVPSSECNETAHYFVLNYDPATSINGRIDRNSDDSNRKPPNRFM